MRQIIIFIITMLLCSCGDYRWGTTTATLYTLDGIKRITPGLSGDNATAWGQSTYTVHSTSRLLLRYENLSKCVSKIDTSGANKVKIYIAVSDATQQATALTALSLCPITANWMMLADWERRHPFGGGAAWTSQGGDYDSGSCVTATAYDAKSMVFDVTNWFLDYPKGRGANYGMLLKSTESITVSSETSGSYSPRIEFQSSWNNPCGT